MFSKRENHCREFQIAPQILATLQTDPGCVRKVNEDFSRFILPDDSKVLSQKGALLIVADGMGGHSAGEVASGLAVEAVSRRYYEIENNPDASLRAALEEANAKIYDLAQSDESLTGMGTTCTALAVCEGFAHVAHVGDSRLYLIRGGELYQMTEDHSAVMEMVRQGIISKDEARSHEDKNVIIRALGTARQVEVSIWENPLEVKEHDRFLLCSDGLTDLVEDAEINGIVSSADDNHSACENLIQLAKRRGGYDNITVGILSIQPAGQEVPENPRETREIEVAL